MKGEVFAVSMELGFSDVLVPEILRLRGDLSAGTSGKEESLNTVEHPKLKIFHKNVKLLFFHKNKSINKNFKNPFVLKVYYIPS